MHARNALSALFLSLLFFSVPYVCFARDGNFAAPTAVDAASTQIVPQGNGVSAQAGAPEEIILTRGDIEQVIAQLPSAERWLEHLQRDLLPFWTMPEALGSPVGNFPTYRTNAGKLVDWSNPPPEFAPYDPGIVHPDREYLRSRSRQIFAYCIAYQLTGDMQYLEYAQKGLEYNYLREGSFYNPATGQLYSYCKKTADGKTQYFDGTSQDWAYGLTAPAYYYYLTRDENIGKILRKSRKALFDKYDDPSFGVLRWVSEANEDADSPGQREIVSVLDQIYGYALFVYRSFPAREQEEWKAELRRLSTMLVTQFYGSRTGLFWGTAGSVLSRNYEARHTDFGHSAKAMWLLMRIGKMTGDIGLLELGRSGASRLVDAAYEEALGTWDQKYAPKGGRLESLHDHEWWTMAIMDQAAATLALDTPDFLRYLPGSTAFWLEKMVDRENYEIWHFIEAASGKPLVSLPKQHSWKNSFHSFEHALVMYLTAKQFKGEDITLYFAMPRQPEKSELYPYIFEGEVVGVESTGKKTAAAGAFSALGQYKATFRNLR